MLRPFPQAFNAMLLLMALIFLLQISISTSSPDDLPGGCGTPSPCGFAGKCIENPGPEPTHRCECRQPFYGDDCSFFMLSQPVDVGTSLERSVSPSSWDYFELQLPVNAPLYRDALLINLNTNFGKCGFVLSDQRIQFFTTWKPEGFNLSGIYSATDHFAHATPVSLMQQNTIAVSVYGIEACSYAGSFQINTTAESICMHGTYDKGLCVCKFRWTGPNCDRFWFPIVYTMAIASGTFIFGAIITSLLACCLCRKSSMNTNPRSTQGYEQYR